jgi:cell division protein FtsZ
VLISIVGGPDLKLKRGGMEEAASLIQQAHEDANIIWGASIDGTAGEW